MSRRICLIALVALFCHAVAVEASDIGARPGPTPSSAQFRSIQGVAGHWTLNYATGKLTPGTMPLRAEFVYDNRTNDPNFGHAPDFPPGDPKLLRG